MDLKYTKSNIIQINTVLEKLWNEKNDEELPVEGWRTLTSTYEEPGSYRHLEDWHETREGEAWAASPEITAFFSAGLSIPDNLKDKNLFLCLKVGGEALLRINGKAFHGLDRNRDMIKLGENEKNGDKLELLVEAAVDRQSYEFQFRDWGNKVTYRDHRFVHARLAVVNEKIWEYYFHLFAAKAAYISLPEGEVKEAFYQVLKKSMLALDFTGERSLLLESIDAAKALLETQLDKITARLSKSTIHLLGHSHIDVGYLWPIKETVRKLGRTFSTALRLMDRYGHYKFIQSQALLYDYAKTVYPEIYSGIKQKVQAGQWEAEGAMWVEPDCNLISGESFIRQILIGKRFFREELGKECRILWLPDTFGFSSILPQIMKGCGLDYFATQKIMWSKTNTFPYNLFKWKSADGSEVLALLTGSYNGSLSGEEIGGKYEAIQKEAHYDDHPLLYGFGDGGGGVTQEMLETAPRLDRFSKTARFQISTGEALFSKLEKTENLPVWEDELYLEGHRGVFTSHGELKKLNRRCERLLRDTEFFLTLAGLPRDSFAAELEALWKKVLTNQFHDILPGSSIKETFEDAVASYREVVGDGEALKTRALQSLYEDEEKPEEEHPGFSVYTLWNTLSWEREELAVIHPGPKLSGQGLRVTDEKGEEVPSQRMRGGELVFPVSIPSMGYRSYKVYGDRKPIRDGKPEKGSLNEKAEPGLKRGETLFENRYFRIRFNEKGNIGSLIDKRAHRELLPAGKEANLFQIFVDEPQQYDAWEVEEFDSNRWYENFGLEELAIEEEGPVIKSLCLVKSWNKSRIRQSVILYENLPRIDFKTEVHWQEDRKMLKVAFPADIASNQATYDIAYGTIVRPTHNNTSWEQAKFEVPAHMWADLSEYGYGVSLMNDCKYGYDIKGSTLRLTLLKAPVNPNPQADRGVHHFTYSLYPHKGSWQEGETARQAYQLNTPLTVLENKRLREKVTSGSWLGVDCPNVIVEALKPAEDGNGIVVRLLEKFGQRSCVNVRVWKPIEKVYRCNMLEEPLEELPEEAQGKAFNKDGEDGFTFIARPYKIETFRILF